jgi:hypothetical protein
MQSTRLASQDHGVYSSCVNILGLPVTHNLYYQVVALTQTLASGSSGDVTATATASGQSAQVHGQPLSLLVTMRARIYA